MEKIVTALGYALGVVGGLTVGAGVVVLGMLIAALVAPLVGAFTGAAFGFFFPETAGALIALLGFPAGVWQLGAALGFVGWFFRTRAVKVTT